ncbi:family 43 glycosylhydrolase [Bacteroides sp. CR5/BHMF/2]|nr:family 43 glycosylhydrolase [Bacteroides sp. CR5/BHMF/2]
MTSSNIREKMLFSKHRLILIYEYRNPIVCGFYPDPSICRKGEDYYMIHSSFSYYPGIPILHSRDLVHWEQIGHVLDRPSQLKLDNIRLSGGIYAPAISYNPANDTFYVVTTCVDGIGNFVVKRKTRNKVGATRSFFLKLAESILPSSSTKMEKHISFIMTHQ